MPQNSVGLIATTVPIRRDASEKSRPFGGLPCWHRNYSTHLAEKRSQAPLRFQIPERNPLCRGNSPHFPQISAQLPVSKAPEWLPPVRQGEWTSIRIGNRGRRFPRTGQRHFGRSALTVAGGNRILRNRQTAGIPSGRRRASILRNDLVDALSTDSARRFLNYPLLSAGGTRCATAPSARSLNS